MLYIYVWILNLGYANWRCSAGIHSGEERFPCFCYQELHEVQDKDRRFYGKLLNSRFRRKKEELKAKLKEAKYVCTTADCWTSRRRSFLALTVHWYTEDLVRKSACLAVRRIKGTHNYSSLAKILEDVHEEYAINKKTTACITDSGSNFIKAFRLFGPRLVQPTVQLKERSGQPWKTKLFFLNRLAQIQMAIRLLRQKNQLHSSQFQAPSTAENLNWKLKVILFRFIENVSATCWTLLEVLIWQRSKIGISSNFFKQWRANCRKFGISKNVVLKHPTSSKKL